MSKKTTGKADVSAINALAELERLGLRYEGTGDYEVRILCPFHDDSTPSCYLNTEKNVFKCQTAGCEASGDFVKLYAGVLKTTRAVALEDLSKRYDISTKKTVKPERVEEWHERIWKSGPMLSALRKRGVTDEDIRAARLGFDQSRITIPIPDERGRYINVRKYLPGAPTQEKMRNLKGYDALSLYQPRPNQLKYDDIWICGGEMKALVASRLLNPHQVGAVSVTGSEGSWDYEFNPFFKDKRVFVCMDIDAGGKAAARKLARKLSYDAAAIFVVELPLNPEAYPKGDLNDYVGQEDATDADLLNLMTSSEQFHLAEEDLPENVSDEDVTEVKLKDSTSANLYGKRIMMDAVVNAMDTTPYIVPKTVGVSCDKAQPNCDSCPVRPQEPDPITGEVEVTIRGTSEGLLNLINSPKRGQKDGIREACRIPPCKSCKFRVKDHFNIHDVRLVPPLDVGGENRDHVVQPSYVVDADLELNSPYVMSGRVFPHPRNQQAILLLDSVKKAEDNLSSYHPSNEDLERLKIFQVNTTIDAKLDEIYTDLESNVTQIYHRRNLHLAMDLAFHSVLNICFDGSRFNGWVNLLVTGDSSQGKSEVSRMLMSHYGVGAKYECKNATAAGLIGGATQMTGGNRWFIQWGVIPTHDKRLVVMEEIKGTPTEVLGRLTDMRSSGVAEVTMIERRKAHARTRLIMISNPRTDRPLAAYNFGIESIRELIGSLEDVRRFDLAHLVSSEDVDPKEINRLTASRPKQEHRFTSRLCRELILWAWSRTESQVRITPEAEDLCLKNAIKLCEKFTEVLPLVDRGTMRYKLARLSTALAARVFSTDRDDLQTLLVKGHHVTYITQWIDEMYSSNIFGYEDFSKAQIFANKLIDPEIVTKQIKSTKYPRDLVEHLLHSDEITLIDLADWCDLEKSDAQTILSFLVRKHALYRVKRWYVKTGEFISLLKKIKADGVPETGAAGKDDTF